jgi:hypothetical protein
MLLILSSRWLPWILLADSCTGLIGTHTHRPNANVTLQIKRRILRVEFHVALIIGHSLRSTNTQSFAQGTADIRTGTPSQITAPTETWGAGLSSTPHSIDSATISLGRPLGSESDPTQSSGVVPSNQSKTFRADLTPVSVPAMPIDSDLEELVFIQAASQGASSASSGRPSNAIIHRNAVLRSSNNTTPFLLQIGAGSVRTVLDDRQPEG